MEVRAGSKAVRTIDSTSRCSYHATDSAERTHREIPLAKSSRVALEKADNSIRFQSGDAVQRAGARTVDAEREASP